MLWRGFTPVLQNWCEFVSAKNETNKRTQTCSEPKNGFAKAPVIAESCEPFHSLAALCLRQTADSCLLPLLSLLGPFPQLPLSLTEAFLGILNNADAFPHLVISVCVCVCSKKQLHFSLYVLRLRFEGVLMRGTNPSLPVQFICRNGVIASNAFV